MPKPLKERGVPKRTGGKNRVDAVTGPKPKQKGLASGKHTPEVQLAIDALAKIKRGIKNRKERNKRFESRKGSSPPRG